MLLILLQLSTDLEWLHFGCFSHALQLGVQKAISLTDLSIIFGQAQRKLVGIFIPQ